jgi:hypothetical protein
VSPGDLQERRGVEERRVKLITGNERRWDVRKGAGRSGGEMKGKEKKDT